MSDTLIKENLKIRQLGGGLLLVIGVPLTLLALFFGMYLASRATDLLLLLPGPAMLAVGLWAAFPRRSPRTKLRISDDNLHFALADKVLSLDDLIQIRAYVPIFAKHSRLIFGAAQGDTSFDVVHLTHESQDIINLVSVRLEKRGKYLQEGLTDVLGARNGIWTVQTGLPFETGANHVKNANDQEQNKSDATKR